ncbi:hypothetical protein WJX73_010129 [Symbiochloris irregularis]|uniref:Protein phosphatase inhibitor 2 n=1 Tax=Symbiochloris irregularis TaxID=706552 RepID=A0AAW1NLL6_9CHLO
MKRTHTETNGCRSDKASKVEPKVQWDEANLEENDKLKEELHPRKCDEPKTPYHGPLDTDEELSMEEADIADLGDEGQSNADAARRPNGSALLQEVVDALPQPNGDHYIERSRATSDSMGDSADTSKRRRFEEHRKAHYKMRDALKRGKQLASDDLEDEADSLPKANGRLHRHEPS